MKDLLAVLETISTLAFVLLGLATAISWTRHRERSLGFLALAIILLSLVSVLGRIPALLHFTPPLVTEITLVLFVGSSYALLRFRGSLIPLPRAWHVAAVVAMAVAIAVFLIARFLGAVAGASTQLETAAALVIVVVWAATVIEPIVRFWMVASSLPAVQGWRLRSLSLGFAGIVGILAFAIAASALASNLFVQIAIQIVVLAIVPLLYVSFAPPAWLRREWRASEEEGLRAFMEDLLLLKEDQGALAGRALDWAMRLVGGATAVAFDGQGAPTATRGLDPAALRDIKDALPQLPEGVSRLTVVGIDRTVLSLPIASLGDPGRLVVMAGPFTPGFGTDELSRVKQFMSAVVAALDRARLLDRIRQANTSLGEANRHKSVFLASMSHELRTPLNAILGFSELLIDANNGQFPPATRKRFLEQIHTSGKHLLGLINDILDLSKIEAGQMDLRLQTIAVAEIVSQVTATIEALATQKNIRLIVGESSAGDITADPGKVKQMLLNLVSNAVKFTPEGGTVTIETRQLDDWVEISITDTGIGIAKQDQDRVFHEFQQVDSGVGRSQPGTGLGLTLTRRFARLHGGDVRMESEPGKGSVFTITLPITAEASETSVASPDPFTATGDKSRPLVLVVEDDPAAAELLTRQLARAGFSTDVARNGKEAISKAIETKPAAITLDILLPDIDGWEVLTRLKREPATSDIPVVVVSVVDNPELGVALGALDYFVKPVPAKELISRLSRFKFGRKAGQNPSVLIVDDEHANREWLKRILEPAGFLVMQASGGREAIELTKARKPDLVMLDLMMPEVTGFDVVEALRADRATQATPIMVLTAKHLTEGDIHQLNGHVSTILKRGSTGAADLLGLLRQIVDVTASR
ncbi:MAG TPA: response regulator [Candidatus Dormibacteraeota bacterium]|nr:response regulator [Candidatus Dormibacteraeota bacterium]